MDLSSFLKVTPDTIYKDGTASITFFFVPKTGQFFDKPFPINHQDMLTDEDEDVFDAIYPDLMDNVDRNLRKQGLRGAKLDATLEKELEPYKSRGKASHEAVLGRFGLLGGDPVIAVWRSVDDPQVKQAITALMKKYPQIKKMMGSVIVVGADGNTEISEGKPVLLSNLFGSSKGVQKAIPELTKQIGLNKPKDYDIKKYNINGVNYSLADISKLRQTTHTRRNYDPMLPSNPFDVLCHLDMKNYPELVNYIPNCPGIKTGSNLRPTHPAVWRQKARELGIPGVYDYGEYVIKRDCNLC